MSAWRAHRLHPRPVQVGFRGGDLEGRARSKAIDIPNHFGYASNVETRASSPKPRRWLRRIAWILGALVAAVVLGAVFVWIATERRIAAKFAVPKEELEIPTDAASVKRGERLARTRGCLECHGESGAGQLFLDAMPVMELRPTNISPGGKVATWSGSDWARAVRHCVRADGTGVPFMPCEDYRFLDDRDLGQIVAYLRTLPASDNDPGATRIGPLGRVLFLKGDLPLSLIHI